MSKFEDYLEAVRSVVEGELNEGISKPGYKKNNPASEKSYSGKQKSLSDILAKLMKGDAKKITNLYNGGGLRVEGRKLYNAKGMQVGMLSESLEINEAAKFSWDDTTLYYSTVKDIDGKIAQSPNAAAAEALANKSFMKVDKTLLEKLGMTKKQINTKLSDDASGQYIAKGYFFANGADIRSFIEEADNSK
jgi:hypothetical protein